MGRGNEDIVAQANLKRCQLGGEDEKPKQFFLFHDSEMEATTVQWTRPEKDE